MLLAWLSTMLSAPSRQPILLEEETHRESPQRSPPLAGTAFPRMARPSNLGTYPQNQPWPLGGSCKSDGRVERLTAGRYTVQKMSSFFSTWAKSLSLVAREALRWEARAAAKQSV